MSTTDQRLGGAAGVARVVGVDMKLEVVTVPVSDVDRATEFYRRLGWRQDVTPPGVVQFTPHGSGCSVQFGAHRTSATPGSAQGLFLVVSDLEGTLHKLASAGIQLGEVWHLGASGRASGLDPGHGSYRSYATLRDPDGNGWLFQEVTTRLPGRVDPATTSFASATDLAGAMRRASIAHGAHEKRIGAADPDWPDWYAAYMVAEQAGTNLPQ